MTLKEKECIFIVVQYFFMHAGDSSSHHTLPSRVHTHTHKLQYAKLLSLHILCTCFLSVYLFFHFSIHLLFFTIWPMCLCCWVVRVNSYLDLVGCSLFVPMLPLWKRHPRIQNRHSNHHCTHTICLLRCDIYAPSWKSMAVRWLSKQAKSHFVEPLNLMVSRPCSFSGRKEAFVGMPPRAVTTPHPQVFVPSLQILVNAWFCCWVTKQFMCKPASWMTHCVVPM